ncbi:MAG: acetoin utilization protein AcuC [Chthonomonadales bacterium]
MGSPAGVFVYTDDFRHYDMGPLHPLKPARLLRTYALLESYGALEHVEVRTPQPCSMEDLLKVHSAEYIEAVDRLSSGEHVPFPQRYGFGYGDNPVFAGMWEASLLYTGASVDAAQAVLDGAPVAMNISGGLHHAHFDRAAGFCVFNDCVAAIHRLKRKYQRIAYVDIDVHHGDGVQEAFYDDNSVLTISIHETGQTLFPGTGFVHERGVREGLGYSVNLPMWPYTTDDIWLGAWRDAGLPILRAFDPEAIVLEMGADPHYLDPLARLCLTAQGWVEAVRDVAALEKPIVALGGGGYNPTTVPRMWALAFGVLFGVELSDTVPHTFPDHERMPTLTDHEDPPIAPHDRERAMASARDTVEQVRQLIFPIHHL